MFLINFIFISLYNTFMLVNPNKCYCIPHISFGYPMGLDLFQNKFQLGLRRTSLFYFQSNVNGVQIAWASSPFPFSFVFLLFSFLLFFGLFKFGLLSKFNFFLSLGLYLKSIYFRSSPIQANH